MRGLCQRCWKPVQRAEAEHTPERTFTTPVAAWGDGELAGNVVFLVVDVETEWPVDVLDREAVSCSPP